MTGNLDTQFTCPFCNHEKSCDGTNPQHRDYIMQCLFGGVPDSNNLYPLTSKEQQASSCLADGSYFHITVKLLAAVVVVGLGGVHAVLGVVDLAGQAVGGHALLGGHFVGAHLQGDGAGVTVLQLQILVKDVPPGSWSCHTSLGEQRGFKIKKKKKTFHSEADEEGFKNGGAGYSSRSEAENSEKKSGTNPWVELVAVVLGPAPGRRMTGKGMQQVQGVCAAQSQRQRDTGGGSLDTMIHPLPAHLHMAGVLMEPERNVRERPGMGGCGAGTSEDWALAGVEREGGDE
ncbi:hypothetical protein INR49_032281 [Caranx melampygus]|nr:hypothetical protein INR49_032281 [Caranx melampygus]